MELTEARKLALKRAGKHYAATYLLLSIAVDHAEEGEMALRQIGMNRNEIKMNANRTMKAFDAFFTGFKRYLHKDDGKVIMRDFENLKPQIDKILDLNL